tara:strand:+ start:1083 stop:1415 length:333 start_codon:yes stop_codon:yes gene_type:complete
MARLTIKDYKIILKHYKLKIPKKNKDIKQKAIMVFAGKLCRCIKQVKKTINKRNKKKFTRKIATAICTSSIFKKRGLKHYKFTCKRPRLIKGKKSKRYLDKTRKRFNMKR